MQSRRVGGSNVAGVNGCTGVAAACTSSAVNTPCTPGKPFVITPDSAAGPPASGRATWAFTSIKI